MKLKRLLCLCLALCMVFSLSLPAFAVNGEETGSEPSETPVEVTEGEEVTEPSEEPTEPSETPVEDTEVETPTEPSEEPTEPSEPVVMPTPSLDGATVNISPESISQVAQATAAAVGDTGYDYQYVLSGSNGITYTINCNEPSLLTDYYVYIGYSGWHARVVMLVSEEPLVWQSRDGISEEIFLDVTTVPYKLGYISSTYSFDTVSSLTNQTTNRMGPFYWTNTHIVDFKTGSLFYQSSYVPPITYTVSFVTGIEDFTIDSVTVNAGEVYNLPEFSYSGYQYMGAFTDETYETAYVGGSEITGDLTLYLKFEPIVYDVGSTVAEISNRLEGLTYVVLAQSIITSVGVLALFFFRRDGMGV